MTPEEYTRQSATLGQAALSNVFMGLRQAQAERDSNRDFSLRERDFSLREKAFEQDQLVRRYQIADMEQKQDLQKTSIFGASAVQGQVSDLYNAASIEDFEKLKTAKYQAVEVPGASPMANAQFNNQSRDAFNLARSTLLSASAGQKHRLDDINNLSVFASSLEDPIQRGVADEARMLLQRGVSISELPPNHADALRASGIYASRQALARNPTYMSKMLELEVNRTNKLQDNQRDDIKTIVENAQNNVRTEKTIYGQAVASGNTKAMEAQQKKVEEAETNLAEILTKANQMKRGTYTNQQGSSMLETSVLPKDARYRLSVRRPGGKTLKPFLATEEQYQEAIAGQEKGELELLNFEILPGK